MNAYLRQPAVAGHTFAGIRENLIDPTILLSSASPSAFGCVAKSCFNCNNNVWVCGVWSCCAADLLGLLHEALQLLVLVLNGVVQLGRRLRLQPHRVARADWLAQEQVLEFPLHPSDAALEVLAKECVAARVTLLRP
jgi:hypothetical protein